MTVLIIIIHVLACVALIGIVLIQRGRGGGLVETFSSVESMFGPKTSAFLTKTTSILSVVFFLTCLSLAILSVKQSRSLIQGLRSPQRQKVATPLPQEKTLDARIPVPKPETPPQETVKPDALKTEPSNQQPDKIGTSKEAGQAQQ